MPHLELAFLGSLDIKLDGQPVAIPPGKSLALLAYLAVTGTAHTRDSLAALFWPESDTTHARNSLRSSLWKLNQSGLADWLEADPSQISLRPGFSLDVTAFRLAADQAFKHDHNQGSRCPECLDYLSQAASIYQGDFLKGFSLKDSLEFDDWQVFQAEDLSQSHSQVLERLVQQLILAGELEPALGYARKWANIDPLHEPAQRALMRLYLQTGKREMALKRYRNLKQQLHEELGVEPELESRQLYLDIQKKEWRAETSGPIGGNGHEIETRPLHNLPAQLSSFVGRSKESAQILSILKEAGPGGAQRLITLTGTGGSGKTRLALQIASQLLDSYSGVWVVQLAGLNDPELVPRAIVASLDLPEQPGRSVTETLIHILRARVRVLLVLDNCEHLLPACARLANRLLEECPQLQILATSIQALGITGEVIWPVAGLSLPPTLYDWAELPRQSEAVQLFVDRTRQVRPDFELNERNAPVIAQICKKIDGLPLAIELAAARMQMFSVEDLEKRLEDRFQLLRTSSSVVVERHQTLQAVVEWSYNLLSQAERSLFKQLSVFRGGFRLEAAEAIFEGDRKAPVFELLASLIEKSMVTVEPDPEGRTRYQILATLQQYGQTLFDSDDEQRNVQRRHAEYYARLAEETEPELHGPNQLVWLERLEADLDNLRAALGWSAENDPQLGIRLASALWWFWITRGYFREGREWFEQLLELTNGSKEEAFHARAYTRYVWINYFYGDGDTFSRTAEQALRRTREAGAPEDRAAALMMASASKNYTPEAMSSIHMLEEALSIYRETGDKWGTSYALRGLSDFTNSRLRAYQQARSFGLEALSISKELGDLRGIARSLLILGNIENNLGNWMSAENYYQESLSIVRRLKDRIGSAILLSNLGDIAKDQKDYEKATRLQEECLQIHLEINTEDEISATLATLAELALIQKQFDKAYDLCQESIKIADQIKRKTFRIYPLTILAGVYREKGDYAAANAALQEALQRAYEISPAYVLVSWALDGLAQLALALDKAERAASLFGAMQAIREAHKLIQSPHEQENWERNLAEARDRLEEEVFTAAFEAGKGLYSEGLQELIDYASQESV